MATVGDTKWFDAPSTPSLGLADRSEARALITKRFPNKPYCLVEEWTVFHVEVTDDELVKIHEAGLLPLIVFAHKVVEDSGGRFQPGDFVRSTMCKTFEAGVFLETRNTVYALLGPGHEQPASLKDIFSIFK
jgi:hypothetical protein